ncbi:transmembrane protein 192-like [Macrosteles quadrilineatus]|uniref:transmembrane protein 192-like n=1 Tax=Macrosteles quadrilineatus TaxID=74068 RepID=UPI0023E0BF43|nr:transmembrane protein 192-like [Macrosteles quadrilineatus]XP_054262417.1 transmembrane protein 192-like [Macrosteles quadrilineatus]
MIGDETEYLQPVLGTLPSQRFKPMKSRWVAALLLILIVLVEISGIVSALYWPHTALKCEPLYFILYCHAALWILVLFLDHGLKWHHNKLRLEGYLKAYEQMTKIGSLPFYIVSFGNAVLLVMVTVYQQMNLTLEKVCGSHWDSPGWVALMLISVEFIFLSYFLIVYLVNVKKFNSAKAPPDVTSPDTWEAFTNHEVGYREHGEDVQELLQKQADSIRYYKDAVEVLQRKVMGLTAQLRGDVIN